MTTYYIYEVPGHKIGATKNFNRRYRQNFAKYTIEPIILETIEGTNTPEMWQIVGDREWELAEQNGYIRGTHYLKMVQKGLKSRTEKQLQQIQRNLATHDGTNGKIGAPKLYKLNKEIADQIRIEYNTGICTHRQLALKYNISKQSIGRIVRNIGYLI